MGPDQPSSQGRTSAAVERGLLVLLLALIAVLAALWWTRRGQWRDDSLPLRGTPPPYANKLNPNTASWQSLACLPGIGEQKARDIVAYRDACTGPGPAFERPEDLARVKGIGPAIVERASPFLLFAATGPPASMPATAADL